MERLYIRGRLLTLLDQHSQNDEHDGIPAYSMGGDDLVELVENEFGVVFPGDAVPEIMTVDWLVDIVEELTSTQGPVM